MAGQRDYLIVTNNPLVEEKLKNKGDFSIEFRAGLSLKEILILVRDYVYAGRLLYTHPLSGSVKPDETPYKSVIVSMKTHGMDNSQAMMISDAVATAEKFGGQKKEYTERVLKDFRLIDYCLICGALNIDAADGLR